MSTLVARPGASAFAIERGRGLPSSPPPPPPRLPSLTPCLYPCCAHTCSPIPPPAGGSFFGIFSHDHKHSSGFNKTSCLYYQNSNSTVNLYGGNGAKWGDFNWTHPVSPNFTKDWADSLYSDQIPAIFNLQPLPKIFPVQYSKQAVALNTSIQAYFDVIGAKNEAMAKA